MKTALLAFLFGTAAMVPVYAADMPVKAAPRYVAPVSDWSGFYIFGSGGYSWGKISPDDGDGSQKPKGGVFGFGGGYLWQTGRWVGGLEVDYSFSDEKDSQSETVAGDCRGSHELSTSIISEYDRYSVIKGTKCSLTSGLATKIDALGSARIRAGYLLTDSLLAYGTAGLGFGRSQATFSEEFCYGTSCVSGSTTAKQNNFGWVAGGGIELKVFEHLRVRGEYLHYDFGSVGYSFQPLGTINIKTTDDVARGALIWSFN